MQQATPTPHTWQEFIWLSVVAILASGGTWLATWLRKSQSKADVEKTQAETRSIDLSTTIHAGDIVLGLIKEVAVATASVERLRVEKEFWQGKAGALEAEKNLIQRQLDKQIQIGKGD